ncbi:hypothetical protein GCM10025734_44190 [Kitasatospora paranensis]
MPAVHPAVRADEDAEAVLPLEVGQDLHLLPDRLGERLRHPLPVVPEIELPRRTEGSSSPVTHSWNGWADAFRERMINRYRPVSLTTPMRGFPRP